MSHPPEPTSFRPAGFRTRLMVAMMLVISVITALVLYIAERNLATGVEQDLQREFRGELATLHNAQALRQAALVERCRALVRKSRLHAALEDDALDLLYPSARDELRDVMGTEPDAASEPRPYALHAEFYRFLDRNGALISPGPARDAGSLSAEEEARLKLSQAPNRQQIGYLVRRERGQPDRISELIAMPILSSETGDVIAALVLGFKPVPLGHSAADREIRRGLWLDGRLYLPRLGPDEERVLAEDLAGAIANQDPREGNLRGTIGEAPYQLFYNRLNADSLYPPAYEVSVYSLANLRARQARLRWQIIGAGGLLLLGGLVVSHFLAGRLAVPVEKLAVDSAEHLAQRTRAEAALETTSGELQRAARFSADASHQLKTPLAVLRAGLEELQARSDFTPEVSHELSALTHQTYRLSSVIDDLLLLSRMDAGQLKLNFRPVDLSQLLEASLDDLGAQPEASGLAIERNFPAELPIVGDRHYTGLILQNLLENARKYNREGGRIRLAARREENRVLLAIGNTGQPIPSSAQARIFERFHRGAIGENIPGYGLGLNLARELARLHGGDLRLVSSADGWTEFEVSFCAAAAAPTHGAA